MFWRKAEVEEVKPVAKEPVAVIKRVITAPEPELLDMDEEYKQLAVKLGIRLRQPTYDTDKVLNYLHAKFPKWGWVWVPVRLKDAVKGFNFNDTDRRTYKKPIPFAVLKTINEIEQEHPEAKFFISDERELSDEKDPFLMVTLDEGRTLHIVERWDEPSFR